MSWGLALRAGKKTTFQDHVQCPQEPMQVLHPYHPLPTFFGTQLPHQALWILWILVVAPEGTVSLWSQPAAFLPFRSADSADLCPFLFQPLSLQAAHTKPIQPLKVALCSVCVTATKCTPMPPRSLVCEGGTTHLFQAFWRVWKKTNLIQLHFQMQNYYYYY